MGKVVSPAFFNKPTLKVAEELLGCFLCRRIGRKVVRMEITEVEAYDGPGDKASHAHRGKTARNAPMFGEAGRFYVYFTYGMHWLLNIVTGPKGYPAAVLIRAVSGINGPGRVTKALQIDKTFNGTIASPKIGLWVEARDTPIPASCITSLPRIGVTYAGPMWSKKLYRFLLKEKTLS